MSLIKQNKGKLGTMSEHLVSAILVLVSNTLTFLFTRRKYNSELEKNDIQNLQSSFKLYKDLIDDLEIRVEKLQKKIYQLEQEVNDLRVENNVLKDSTCKYAPNNDKKK